MWPAMPPDPPADAEDQPVAPLDAAENAVRDTVERWTKYQQAVAVIYLRAIGVTEATARDVTYRERARATAVKKI